MAFYAGADGELREMPGVAAISCGRNYPVFNSALLTTPVPGINGGLSTRVALASIYFRALRWGWSYWVCHDLLDKESLRNLAGTCRNYGLDPVVVAPGMYTEQLLPPSRPVPSLEIREVNTPASRLAFAHLVSIIFDLPFQMTMTVYGPEANWTPEYAGFLGYVGDRPVTMAMVNVSDNCCGFYSVGTVPGHRRRGYAEALMRSACDRLRERVGFEGCVLQSSTVGRRLYERMGFRAVTHFSVFRSLPDPDPAD